jgi:hypothetical protein
MTVTTHIPDDAMTPAGIQPASLLARRRLLAFLINGAIYLALLWWLASILSVGGWSVIDVLIFACFAIAAPWSVLGVWNAVVGLLLLRLHPDPMEAVAPFAKAADADPRLDSRVHDAAQRRSGPRLRAHEDGERQHRRHGRGRAFLLVHSLRHQ